MKTQVIQAGTPEEIEAGTPAGTVGAAPNRRTLTSSQRVAVLVVGGFVALVGVLALVAGGALLWVDTAKTDADGYYTTSAHRFSTNARALTTNGLDADTGELGFLLSSGHLAQVRLTSTGNDPAKPLFVGIARERDVAAYLRDVEVDEVGDIDFDPFRVTYSTRPGAAAPTPPTELAIWAASTAGVGTETLQWAAEEGTWSVVVMNADGSPNVDADIAVAGTAPIIFRIGLGLAIGGFVLVLISAIVLILTLRTRPGTPAVGATPLSQTP